MCMEPAGGGGLGPVSAYLLTRYDQRPLLNGGLSGISGSPSFRALPLVPEPCFVHWYRFIRLFSARRHRKRLHSQVSGFLTDVGDMRCGLSQPGHSDALLLSWNYFAFRDGTMEHAHPALSDEQAGIHILCCFGHYHVRPPIYPRTRSASLPPLVHN